MQKIGHYFSSLFVLVTFAVLYNGFMDRWLQPPKVITVKPKPEEPMTPQNTLGDLFPEGAWQRGLCKQLQTSDGMLLFENWQQVADDQWKLWPITVVIGRGIDGNGKDPVILNADEGAEIRFAESFDVMSGSRTPPIRRGRMKGIVEIRRKSSDPKREPLLIRTQDVGIDSRKLWTTQPIHVLMGKSKLIGRDLTLHLAASAGAKSSGSGTASVLDRMELIYLDEMTIPLEKPLLKPDKTVAKNKLPTHPTSPKSPTLSLKCNGRVEYDFAIGQLSLYEKVTLSQINPGIAVDRFQCEALHLRLHDPDNKRLRRDHELDWLDHIRASGDPVLADLPSLNCRIASNEIEFDAIRGVLNADGDTGVQIWRGGMHAQLTQLNYVYDPADPYSMGTVDNWGPGTVRFDDPEVPLKGIQWSERVQFWPHGKSRVDQIDKDLVVRITGSVQAKLSDGGEFQSDAIECVLTPHNVTDLKTRKLKRTLRPDRFEATGDVQIDTNAVAAKTKRLVLFFVEQLFAPQKSETAKPQGSDESASSLRKWVIAPQDQPTTKPPVARIAPKVEGDLITAKLSLNDGNIVASDLSVRGAVKLKHTVNAGGQALPAELTGAELRLRDGGGKDVLYLGSRSGAQSKLKLGDGYFLGPLIQVWPNDNVVRIEGAGEVLMPTAVLPKTLTGNDPNRIRWTKAPFCKWKGGMVFDGKTATLTEDVDITADLTDREQPIAVHMLGDRLEMVLLEDVNVGQFQSMQSASIQQVTMLQNSDRPVRLVTEQFEKDGLLESRHILHAPQLRILPSGNGKLVCAGPGSYRSWTFSNSEGVLSQGRAKKTQSKEKRLMGMHLIYQDTMEGDMMDRTLAFSRGVRVRVRPVNGWKDQVDARQVAGISVGDSTVDCDKLQISIEPQPNNMPRIPGLPTPWEMQAIGGVVFRTRRDNGLLEGTASRAVYTAKKDLFTLRGAPNRGAIIKKTNVDGTPGPQVTVREMTIRAESLEIVNMELEQATIGTLPARSTR